MTQDQHDQQDTFRVDVPGAFQTFFTGTGCYAGQLYSTDPDQERGSRELRAAWDASTRVRRGRGLTFKVELPSIEAVVVLAELAEACLAANRDEPDYSEVSAARRVLDRVETATDGRVTFGGYYVMVDGVRS